jgi:hypothetical protein
MTLDTGIEVAREAQRLSDLSAAASELKIVLRERALELALARAAQIFDNLEGAELRDWVVRFLSESENEARQKSLFAATLLMSFGVPADDAVVTELYDRATR